MSTLHKDPIWESIRKEAEAEAKAEPMLASFFHGIILNHRSLEDALSFLLASKLQSVTLNALTLRDLIDNAFKTEAEIGVAIREDMKAVLDRDPACTMYSTPLLYFKGYQALQAYRVANFYWKQNRKQLALFLQSQISEVYTVDIHPAARIGKGILIDHAHSIVIGETAVVEDNVSMLHEVTLGGSGKHGGDRHPKVRHGVLLSAGSKIFGNVEIGEGAKIGGGAVVLHSIPPHTTAVGVPAKAVGHSKDEQPALSMNQNVELDIDENRSGAGI